MVLDAEPQFRVPDSLFFHCPFVQFAGLAACQFAPYLAPRCYWVTSFLPPPVLQGGLPVTVLVLLPGRVEPCLPVERNTF